MAAKYSSRVLFGCALTLSVSSRPLKCPCPPHRLDLAGRMFSNYQKPTYRNQLVRTEMKRNYSLGRRFGARRTVHLAQAVSDHSIIQLKGDFQMICQLESVRRPSALQARKAALPLPTFNMSGTSKDESIPPFQVI
ncbi:uncharacterized protein B0I36DRAFT_356387 [Microdochium trichocladiopsis]|uniref:Uncharacterized protein n=1 Tax=Microdochium trichocladiopsis TaxID=1682393 RepID=A0A9P8XQ35_9PEZI|nr:uncharacterized protein B0I36DRAFT_356387 [Microdochium trichocladiopsis]KAH7010764.1 hypothetical protein B0I36DRAFT_356387 [Microdochium trichocladiopsis]